MIFLKEVVDIHTVLISTFGGSHGLRDRGSLESSLARPFLQFDGKELYPNILLKTSALLESILINHPFIDGNKRLGYVVGRMFLIAHGLDISAS